MKFEISMMVLASLAASAEAVPKCIEKVDNVRIMGHSARPSAASGFVRTWIVVRAEVPRKGPADFHIPYMAEDQVIPMSGSLCSLKYHVETIDEITSSGVKSSRDINFVDDISCR